MKWTILVNIPMSTRIYDTVYVSTDASLSTSQRAVGYAVLSYLETILQPEDTVFFILVAKRSAYSNENEHIAAFQKCFSEINRTIGVAVDYQVLYSDFREDRDVHEQLMLAIVDAIDAGAHLIADITYGPKDAPIVVFTALNFVERFLNCKIEHILYGQGLFDRTGQLIQTQLCDLSPLYSLHTLIGHLQCDDPKTAKDILRTIILL